MFLFPLESAGNSIFSLLIVNFFLEAVLVYEVGFPLKADLDLLALFLEFSAPRSSVPFL
jgi:hypothetical protein